MSKWMVKEFIGVIFVDTRVGYSIDSLVGSEVVMESGDLRQIKEIEIGQLHLRYAHTRIERPKESLRLAGSINLKYGEKPVYSIKKECLDITQVIVWQTSGR